MSKIDWNLPGERLFEAGVDRVVLFPRLGSGVAWNGVVSINESVSGGDIESVYYDGVKVLDLVAYEDFQTTLDAFNAPLAFAACDGTKQLFPGLYVTQQPRKTFGLCYRTLIGDDLVSTERGYKLHLVYGCMASPANKSNQTISDSISPTVRSWQINTVPPPATKFRPTAHLVLDSTKSVESAITSVENVLYGTQSTNPRLPTIDEIITLVGG